MNDSGPVEGGDLPIPEDSPRRSPLLTAIRVAMFAGALAILFATVLWAADDLLGITTRIPYLAIGVAGLIVYTLSRLPAYAKILLPKPEEPAEKFHRK